MSLTVYLARGDKESYEEVSGSGLAFEVDAIGTLIISNTNANAVAERVAYPAGQWIKVTRT